MSSISSLNIAGSVTVRSVILGISESSAASSMLSGPKATAILA